MFHVNLQGWKEKKVTRSLQRTNTLLLLDRSSGGVTFGTCEKLSKNCLVFPSSSCVWDYEHVESTLGEHMSMFLSPEWL